MIAPFLDATEVAMKAFGKRRVKFDFAKLVSICSEDIDRVCGKYGVGGDQVVQVMREMLTGRLQDPRSCSGCVART